MHGCWMDGWMDGGTFREGSDARFDDVVGSRACHASILLIFMGNLYVISDS